MKLGKGQIIGLSAVGVGVVCLCIAAITNTRTQQPLLNDFIQLGTENVGNIVTGEDIKDSIGNNETDSSNGEIEKVDDDQEETSDEVDKGKEDSSDNIEWSFTTDKVEPNMQYKTFYASVLDYKKALDRCMESKEENLELIEVASEVTGEYYTVGYYMTLVYRIHNSLLESNSISQDDLANIDYIHRLLDEYSKVAVHKQNNEFIGTTIKELESKIEEIKPKMTISDSDYDFIGTYYEKVMDFK